MGGLIPRVAVSAWARLLVGYYDEQGHLRYAGRVGTGINDKELAALRRFLDGLAVDQSPFAQTPRSRGCHWVAPPGGDGRLHRMDARWEAAPSPLRWGAGRQVPD